MAFATKTSHGLLALLELAGAAAGGGRLATGEIARRQGIPERYLEQVMAGLRRGELVRSVRGPQGGYELARPAERITVAQVVQCLQETRDSPTPEPATPEQEVIAQLAAELEMQWLSQLESTSLAALSAQRNALLQSQAMYFI